MAGAPLTTKESLSSAHPWAQKALNAASTAGKAISIVNGVREAIPVVRGVVRAGQMAASYAWPLLAAAA